MDLGAAPPSAVETMGEGLSALGRGAAALAREGGQRASEKAAALRARRMEAQHQRKFISYEEPPTHPFGPAFLNLLCIPGMGHAVYRAWGRMLQFGFLSLVAIVIDVLMMDGYVYDGPLLLGVLKVWSAIDVWKVGSKARKDAEIVARQ